MFWRWVPQGGQPGDVIAVVVGMPREAAQLKRSLGAWSVPVTAIALAAGTPRDWWLWLGIIRPLEKDRPR